MPKIVVCLIVFCLFSHRLVHAVDTVPFHFRHYNIENGLSSNSVNALLQDSKGYIWMGTGKGLDKFDGSRFICYHKKGSGFHGFDSNEATAIYESSDNRIWVGTGKGVYIYDPETGKFRRFDLQTSGQKEITSQVNSITQDKDGVVWIATRVQGVFSYDSRAGSLKCYEMQHSNGYIYTVLPDKNGDIWLAGKKSVYQLDREKDRFEPFLFRSGKSFTGIALFEDSEGNLWLGTWYDGLVKIDKNRDLPPHFYLQSAPGKETSSPRIHSIIEYAPGMLLIGSDQGLIQFDTATGSVICHVEEEGNPVSLSNRFVYPLLKDRDGGLWVGTYYGGVNYASPYSSRFEGYSRGGLLQGKIISCFCEDSKGNVYIGSDDGGVACFSTAERQFRDFPGREKIAGFNVHALYMDNDNLWIGTYASGLHVLDIRTGKLKKMAKGWTEKDAYALLKDRNNRMWIGTMQSIFLYRAETDSFSLVKRVDGLVGTIKEDMNGHIWAGTIGKGLFKYVPEENDWKHYGLKEGLPDESVLSIHIDSKNQILAGTGEGMGCYEQKKDRFEYIPLKIPDESINCILEGDDCLWLTTQKGLVQYFPEGDMTRVYTRSDGIQSETFVMGAGLKTQSGEIFVGGTNGFNLFDPQRIYRNQNKPVVVLTGLEVFNKEIPVTDDGILTSPLDRMEEIHLSHKDNMIGILYAALNYYTPEKNQYAYKLEGFNKDWIYVNSESKATYTNLPPGKYLFRVKAANNEGVWNEEGASVRIVVHPPFYLSTPFIILYWILGCVALVLFMRFLLGRSERKHLQEIERLNIQKEKEVHEAKIKFFTMIAHEIRTPVSLIIGPLDSIREQASALPVAVRENLEVINRNSQWLLYLVNQLLDFRKVEDKEVEMHFVPQGVKELLQSVCDRFHPSMEQKGILFQACYPEDDLVVMVDKEATIKLISNLLTNALKYTRDRIELACSSDPIKHTFTMQITDNGDGISEEEQKKIFRPFYQTVESKPGTGIGLSIVKSIVEAHRGRIDIQSEMGKGTTFIITLPIEQETGKLQDEEIQENTNGFHPDNFVQRKQSPVRTVKNPVMLIVDDNAEMQQFLSSHFAKAYSVVTAVNGEEATEILKKQEVTLIISDWMMPRMNGVELCKAVRDNQFISHIPFILLTAKTDMASKVEGMDCGADIYIEKPFSIHYLEACINNLIEQRLLLREKFSRMPMVSLNSMAGNATDEKFLTDLNETIEQNLSNPELSVDFLAKQLGISRSGLFAKIKMLANVTPNELIQVLRLKRAASLLLEKRYRINEVSYMVGFNDPAYFSKCFFKQFGVKPKDFTKGDIQP